MKTKADIISFLEAEKQLGFITEKIADRLKWYFDTYFIELEPPNEPSIQDEGDVWDDFIVELEQLQRMEENDWEWNKKILKESYSLAKVNSQPQPLQDEGLEEAAEKYANNFYDKNTGSGAYKWLSAIEDFIAGAEYYKQQLNKPVYPNESVIGVKFEDRK